MSAAPVYELFGLRVRSPIPLGASVADGAAELEVSVGPATPVPDEIPAGTVVCELVDGDHRSYTGVHTSTGYALRYHGTADFELSDDSRTVRCVPHPGADPAYLGVLLAGGVLSFVLLLRGVGILHASAVAVGDAALAVVAGSGKGKSTLAAALCAAGAAFVSDDVVRFDFGAGDTVIVRGGVPELRLREGASELSACFEPPAETRRTADGRTGVLPPRVVRSPIRLGVVVLPRRARGASSLHVERLDGAAALLRLAEHPRIHGWHDQATLRAAFRNSAELVQRVPVYEAVLPWDGAAPDELARDLIGAVGLSWPA